MYHYTYLLINRADNMFYVGKRSSKVPPLEDILYKGSSAYVPKNKCIKLILKEFDTVEEALNHEILLHDKLDIANNKSYYNRAKQTSTGFDTTSTTYKCSDIKKQNISNAKKGKVPNWSKEGKQKILQNLKTGNSPEAKKKWRETIKNNPNVHSTSSCKFKPWFITTDSVTHLFTDITKNELSLAQGHYKKYYTALQTKYNRLSKLGTPITTRLYGNIQAIGDLPPQYKI